MGVWLFHRLCQLFGLGIGQLVSKCDFGFEEFERTFSHDFVSFLRRYYNGVFSGFVFEIGREVQIMKIGVLLVFFSLEPGIVDLNIPEPI